MSFMDPVLNWLLMFDPLIAIVIISIILGVFTTLAYKFTSDQKKIKSIKEQIKELQKKMKEIPRDQPDKIMELNSKIMKLNGPMMKESMKPMLYTLIPSLLILTWMTAHLAFHPIIPGQDFNITAEFNDGVMGNVSLDAVPEGLIFVNGATQQITDSKVVWKLRSEDMNEYNINMNFQGNDYDIDVLITEEWLYNNPINPINKAGVKSITVSNQKIKPFKGIPILQGINWLWAYILITMIVSTTLRKALKVY